MPHELRVIGFKYLAHNRVGKLFLGGHALRVIALLLKQTHKLVLILQRDGAGLKRLDLGAGRIRVHRRGDGGKRDEHGQQQAVQPRFVDGAVKHEEGREAEEYGEYAEVARLCAVGDKHGAHRRGHEDTRRLSPALRRVINGKA